ncbi:hypothetical protein [Prochlorococcus sp. MIT 1303]|uniref:hypothetical protein n=1 Tax=Prochlorococcus sp. MIT 1303 TaxID=1723647 RepID=UPI0007B38C89|nr:hypothetical protein [Prochlorococcus sp. MIT 1303]KZR67447.1 hypothetical protein PMIT1303_00547 [Prochlorococcus sp. MIT 1303]
MRWVINSAKELRDGVFTEEEIPPHNLKAMNFKTLLQNGLQQENAPWEKVRGLLVSNRLREGSFEHDQIPQSLETGLNTLNPKAVDPNSLDRLNPKAVEPNPDYNTVSSKFPTLKPFGHDAQNGPIGNEVLDPRDQDGLSPEVLIPNDLILDEMNIDELLNDIEGNEQLINEIIQGGTHNEDQDTTENNGGGGDDDWGGDDDYSNNGNTNPGSEANWTPEEGEDFWNEGGEGFGPHPNHIPTEDNGAGGDDDGDEEDEGGEGGEGVEGGEGGEGGGIMSTGNEAGSPPWGNHLDDITGQEDVMPEVSTMEIPLYDFTNHLQKSGQTINRSPEFLTKDGVINHDYTSVTIKSAFADNGEFIIEAIPSVGETYRAKGLFPCPTIPHIQAKNFSELIPTIAMTTIQDI